MNLTEFLPQLRSRAAEVIGSDYSALGDTAFKSAIVSRARARGVQVTDYIRLCLDDTREEGELMQHLLISESWFQRDIEPLRAAITKLPTGNEPLRMLSAPCAHGEEVITLLACAIEAGISASRVRVDGVDLSQQAITRAKSFSYGRYSFRGSSEVFVSSYFKSSHDIMHLNSELQPLVHYTLGNVIDPHWIPPNAPYHLISCRNLLIYLTSEARALLFKRISELLTFDGVLVVTAAECPFVDRSLFRSCGDQYSVFQLCSGQSMVQVPQMSHSKVRRVPHSPKRSRPVLPTLKRKPTTVHSVDSVEPQELLTDNYEEVLELVEKNPNDPKLLFALGVLSSAAGDSDQAINWFNETLRVDPHHEEAPLFLEALLRK